jgi:hypothetical protein
VAIREGNKMHAPIASANHFESLTIEEASDAEDGNYSLPSLASGTDTEVEAITNEEVFTFILHLQTC